MAKSKPAAAAPAQSLAAFVEATPRRQVSCWVCSLPARGEIDEGIRAGIGQVQILRWLVSLGYKEATYARVDRHKRDRHYALA